MTFQKILKAFVFAAILLVILPNSINAQDTKRTPSLTITPTKFDENVEQKKTYTEVMTLTNSSEIALPISTEIVDYSINEEGIPSYLKDETLWSAVSWVRVEPSTLILESKESQEVKITINVPETAEPGSHYVSVLFKPVLPPDYFDDASTHVISYIGMVVGLNVNAERTSPLRDAVAVLSFSSGIGDSPETRNFSLNLQNSDIYHHKVEGIVTISNMLNKVVDKVEIGDITLFPKIKRILTSDQTNKLFPGIYTATLSIKGEQDELSSSEKFLVFPNPITLVLIVFSVLLIVFILRYRKNIGKAIKELSKKDYTSFTKV